MEEPGDHHEEPRSVDEPPPLGSWKRMYYLVLSVLVIEMVLFTIFTRFFD